MWQGNQVHSLCGANSSLLTCVNQITEMTAAGRKEMLAVLMAAVFGLLPAGGNKGINDS